MGVHVGIDTRAVLHKYQEAYYSFGGDIAYRKTYRQQKATGQMHTDTVCRLAERRSRKKKETIDSKGNTAEAGAKRTKGRRDNACQKRKYQVSKDEEEINNES